MSLELLLSLALSQPAKTANPTPPAPAPAAFDAFLFMTHNDMSAPLPENPYFYQLEYPLICAAG